MQFGPGFLPTFFYYFISTAIVFALISARALDLSVNSGLPQRVGIMGGLVAGFVGSYFNRTVKLLLPVENEETLMEQLNHALTLMGYQQESEMDSILVYERPAPGKFFSGKIFVQMEKDTVAIAGRAVNIKKLRQLIE